MVRVHVGVPKLNLGGIYIIMAEKYNKKEEAILAMIASFCELHPCHECCHEENCMLYRIEKVITEEK